MMPTDFEFSFFAKILSGGDPGPILAQALVRYPIPPFLFYFSNFSSWIGAERELPRYGKVLLLRSWSLRGKLAFDQFLLARISLIVCGMYGIVLELLSVNYAFLWY